MRFEDTQTVMTCRAGCGACCIAPSISAAIPGMPEGKPAGVRCIQLDDNNLCQLFEQPQRPLTCGQFLAEEDYCGDTFQQALKLLTQLEKLSLPE